MSQELELPVDVRAPKSTKGDLKTKRDAGTIPAVLYGSGEPESLWVKLRDVETILHKAHSTNVLVHLAVQKDGKASKKQTALIKIIQRDFVYNHPIHVDFLRVDIHQQVEVSVPVHSTGEPKGVKLQGGILEHLAREIKVKCAASDIPEAIVFDVTPLELGATVTVGDLPVPKGVELITPANHTVFTILVPKAVEEPAPAEGMAPAQPEVITKGKKEEEGAETAEGAKPAAPAKGAAPAKAEGGGAAPKK